MMRHVRRLLAPAFLLAVLVVAAAAAAEPQYPALSGRVVDEAGLLSAPVRARLDSALAAFEAETSNQLVVATLKSLQGYAVEEFGVGLGRAWGIGQEGKNNGALLIVAPEEREVRIEVGYGLEGDLTDALSRDIIENRILPAFRSGQYEAGIEAGIAGMIAALGGSYEPLTQVALPAPQSDDQGMWPIFFVVGLFVFFVFLRQHFAVGRRSGIGPWIAGGLAGRALGGGFSGGRGSGGGFRSGGGSFGGGGASGRW